MTRLERNAWFELAVVALTIAAYAVLYILFGPKPAIAAMAVLALTALQPAFDRLGKAGPKPALDERDQAILMKSSLIGYSVFWLAFVACTMGIWAANQDRGVVPVDVLPLFPVAGYLVLALGRSVATLVQYARSR